MSRITTFLLIAALFFSSSVYTFAQEASTSTAPIEEVSNTNSTPTFHGPLNCTEYYKLGSVKTEIAANIEKTLPGATVLFSGSIRNENLYPLTGGVLFAKVFKEETDATAFSGAHEVVDQFTIKEDVTLIQGGVLPVEHEWVVPVNAEGGKYFVSYYFLDAKQYDLLGYSYADSSPGGIAPFAVDSDYQVAKFVRSATTLNGASHAYSASPVTVSKDEPVVVSVTISNASDQPKTMPLQWNQFAWDNTSEKNQRGTKTEVIKLEPGETKTFSYTAVEQAEPVVHIMAITQDIEAKSFMNVRAVKEGVSGTQFSFAGITGFPLKAQEMQTLAACVQGYGQNTSGNVLTLTLTDSEGAVVHEYKYEGEIFGTLSGFGEKFTPEKSYNYIKLTAKIERDGQVVDEFVKEFNCESIDPASCDTLDDNVTEVFSDLFSKTNILAAGSVLVLIVVLIVVFLLRRSRGGRKENVIDGMEMKLPESN